MTNKICIIFISVFLASCLSSRHNVVICDGDDITYLDLLIEFQEVSLSDSSLFISGTVMDTTNNIKLPGVNIVVATSLPGKIKCGVASDTSGYFKLQSKNISLADTLFIRYIGYHDIDIHLAELKNKYSK